MMINSRFPLSLMLVASLGLVACGQSRDDKRMRFDGIVFRTSAKPIDKKETLLNFRVEVRDALQSQRGALAAATHEATRYCIQNYGTSRFDWTNIIPDSEGSYQIQLDDRDAIFTGRCKP
ncbi:hypothetical protein P5P81_07250 [Tritonibacter mobilis]|nr:hypothetical protein [Tritonibacter mobilis]